jgi:hypothetical protein
MGDGRKRTTPQIAEIGEIDGISIDRHRISIARGHDAVIFPQQA